MIDVLMVKKRIRTRKKQGKSMWDIEVRILEDGKKPLNKCDSAKAEGFKGGHIKYNIL